MPHEDSEPKSRQERKSKGKYNKKYTDEKYTTKHARAYEATFSQPFISEASKKGWTKNHKAPQ